MLFSSLRSCSLIVLIAAGGLTLSAQSDDIDPGGEVYVMNPFEVRATEGYRAQTSVSGTLLDTPVKDIPISLRVITEDFMDDTFVTSLEDAVAYAAGVTQDGETREGGTFNIRGFRVIRAKRNGVTSLYHQDMTNVERVEVVKGPNSILYGEAVPGGLINYVTKKPLWEPFQQLALSIGSYGYRRVEAETTGPLLAGDNGPLLLYRVDASYEEEEGWRDFKDGDKSFVSPVLKFRPWEHTSIMVQAEWTDKNGRQVDGHPLYSSGARAEWRNSPPELKGPTAFSFFNFRDLPYDRIATFWGYEFTSAGRDNYNNYDGELYVLEVVQSLWDERINIRLNATHSTPELDIKTQQMNTLLFKAAEGQTVFANRSIFNNEETTYQLQAAIETEFWGTQHRTLLGGEYIEASFRGVFYDDVHPPFYYFVRDREELAAEWRPSGPITQHEPTPLASQPTGRDFRDRESYAFYFSNLTTLWDGRLRVLLGGRYDHQEQTIVLTGEESPVEEQVVPQAGIIYSPSASLNLYASYSESFVPKRELGNRFNPDNPRVPIRFPLDPLIGKGLEAGMKMELMDGRIAGTVAVFDITYENFVRGERISYFDDRGIERFFVETRQDVEATSTGIEFDFVVSPLENLQLVPSYAYIKTDNGLGSDESFEDTKGVPRHQFSLWSKYTFSDGALEDLSVGLGLQYRGAIRVVDPDPIRVDPDLRAAAYWKVDLMLAYERTLYNRPLDFQLNVKNVFDEQYYHANIIPGDPREVVFSVSTSF